MWGGDEEESADEIETQEDEGNYKTKLQGIEIKWKTKNTRNNSNRKIIETDTPNTHTWPLTHIHDL